MGKHNPSHSGYMGDLLVHHHIDQGRFAVGIPEKVHKGLFKQLHNRPSSWFKMNGLGKALNSLGSLIGALDIIKILAGNPDAPFSSFDINAPLNQLKGMSNPDNPLQNYYYEIKSRNSNNTNLDIMFYGDYEKVNGVYRGIGEGSPASVTRGKDGSITIIPKGSES